MDGSGPNDPESARCRETVHDGQSLLWRSWSRSDGSGSSVPARGRSTCGKGRCHPAGPLRESRRAPARGFSKAQFPSRLSASPRRMLPNSDSACSKLNLSAPALTITTISEPGCNFVRCSRKNSRTRRFARFRSTAPPTLRLAVIPRRVSEVVPGPWSTRKCRLALPRLPRWIRRKSLRERTRRARVSRRSVLLAPGFRGRRHCQTFATLRTTPLQHQAATRRGHASTKTMTAAPPEIAGLISSLHGT